MDKAQQSCVVTFLPDGKSHGVEKGDTLLAAARAAGRFIEAPCDGKGTCGKCCVKASGKLSAPDAQESDKLGRMMAEGFRLACKARIEGVVNAELPSGQGLGFAVLAVGDAGDFAVCPPTLNRMIELEHGVDNRILGAALDIGTTGVVAELFDLTDGASLATVSCLNPQTAYGGDVLTRIAFAVQADDGLALMRKKIVDCINSLLSEAAGQIGADPEHIYEVVVAGNTTMLHLLLGVSPKTLAMAPYRPVFTQMLAVSPAEARLGIAPRGVVTLLPSASAFIGADITAGLLAVGLHKSKRRTLFIDIGTNGEIVLLKDGLLTGTSSAAGPALEGMNITCGCRAAAGAVDRVDIDQGCFSYTVIGQGSPVGLCGSGLIDLVAGLVRCGAVEASGRFAKPDKMHPELAARFFQIDNKPAFAIDEGKAVYLTQKDVRQVQLAKAAIAAASGLLLQEAGICFDELEEVLIAGAFGFHLQPSSLVGIGLLPPGCKEKIRFVGNTAKEGAKAVLLNEQAGREVVAIAGNLMVKELSLLEEFQQTYVRNMAFPG